MYFIYFCMPIIYKCLCGDYCSNTPIKNKNMKISNAKMVKAIAYLLLTVNIFPVIGIIFLHQFLLNMFFGGVIGLIIFFLIRIRSTELENSGGCFIIRQTHPLAMKGYVCPKVEFPITLINQFMIKEGLISDHLDLKINSQNSRKKIKFNLFFFDRKQIKTLRSGIENQISF